MAMKGLLNPYRRQVVLPHLRSGVQLLLEGGSVGEGRAASGDVAGLGLEVHALHVVLVGDVRRLPDLARLKWGKGVDRQR